MNRDPFDPSGDPLDDLLTRSLMSRADAARPGAGSLADVHRRVRQRARRRATVGAGALAGVGVLAVGGVLTQGDDNSRPIGVADGNDQTVSPTDVERPVTNSTIVVDTTVPGMPDGGAYRCSNEIAAPIDPSQPDVTPPGRWFETCEYVDVGTVSTTILVPLPPTTGSAGSEGTSPQTTATSTTDLSGIRVLVANGTGVGGMAGWFSAFLAERGAITEPAANSGGLPARTTVYSLDGVTADAESVAEALRWVMSSGSTPWLPSVVGISRDEAAALVDADLADDVVLVVLGTDSIGAPANPGACGGSYVVEQGDYLAGIAERFGTTVADIAATNGWDDGVEHLILPGELVTIPGAACSTDATVTPTTSAPDP
jgi:LysM repeat protein